MWDGSENKVRAVKAPSYMALCLAVVGGSQPSVPLSPVLFAIFSCYKEQDQLRSVLHSGVFPKQELLTHPAETVDF